MGCKGHRILLKFYVVWNKQHHLDTQVTDVSSPNKLPKNLFCAEVCEC